MSEKFKQVVLFAFFQFYFVKFITFKECMVTQRITLGPLLIDPILHTLSEVQITVGAIEHIFRFPGALVQVILAITLVITKTNKIFSLIRGGGGEGGVFTSYILGTSVTHTPSNPDSISDTKKQFSIPYFRPN